VQLQGKEAELKAAQHTIDLLVSEMRSFTSFIARGDAAALPAEAKAGGAREQEAAAHRVDRDRWWRWWW